MVVGQGGRMADGLGVEPAGGLGGLEPFLDGDAVDAVRFGDEGRGQALDQDSVDSRFAAAFEFSRAAFGSQIPFYAEPSDRGSYTGAGLSNMRCLYCGREADVTHDHVPPKCLLRKPFPANLLTVPSCAPCNNGFARDEEYFRLVIVGLLCHTQEAEALFDGPMARSMDRNRGLEDLMFGSLEVDEGAVILAVDYTRIQRVAEKIARGLEFTSTGIPYRPEQQFEVGFTEVEQGSGPSRFGPDFTCRRLGIQGWEFTLFESVRFEVQPAGCSTDRES